MKFKKVVLAILIVLNFSCVSVKTLTYEGNPIIKTIQLESKKKLQLYKGQ
ncbi:hypothetical protein C7447_102335 [Tenacibaculum adriaticum]|uniref:Lipoprotein n=1 Tax=Tenacibaculum adriaticum TaxID=413713 RepID=A0A5S5DT09_9FLAO|nr:hypothetical protein C7447_102335 [Tenacibaculum adriaticum]